MEELTFSQDGGNSFGLLLDNPFKADPRRAAVFRLLQREFVRSATVEIDKIPDKMLEDYLIFDPEKVPSAAFAALEHSGAWKKIRRSMQETHKYFSTNVF
ncbi:hypothetical protein [Leptospira alexanderi]|uniref:hypothetical protein n=1 Tax=Leptospira alexanderi TaxID=100053 RepID=UPI000990D8BE|nr:hypothetical protein [Leptospira alexanderi]